MSLTRCIFATKLEDESLFDEVVFRAEALARWYGADPDKLGVVTIDRLPSRKLLAGAIDLNGACETDGVGVWGGPVPAALQTSEQLVTADDPTLRTAGSCIGLVAAAHDRLRIVTGAGGVASMHESSTDAVHAWSSHAVAARLLASGSADVAWSNASELIAMNFVGGDRSLLAETVALPDGTVIDVDDVSIRRRSYWPEAERWDLVPEADARTRSEQLLLEDLPRRIPSSDPVLGLTAGLDSQVVALALRRSGTPFRAVTAGDPAWRDVRGASQLAERLGIRHGVITPRLHDDESAHQTLQRLVRWSDGAVIPSLAHDRLADARFQAFVTGAAGEVGRAFHYAPLVRRHPAPSERQLLQMAAPDHRIAGSRREAKAGVRRAVAEALQRAHHLGFTGWRALDVVYGQERLRKWGRSTVPMSPGTVTLGFGTPPLLAALASLPLQDRVSSGFHRWFIERHSGRRIENKSVDLGSRRLFRTRLLAAGLTARVPQARTPESGWPLNGLWTQVPDFHETVRESLADPALIELMGTRWCADQRQRFANGEARATEIALRSAALVTLKNGLQELSATGSGATPLR